MISDVLSDAVDEIERHLEEMPAVYDEPEFRTHIDRVGGEMDGLRERLDTAPVEDPAESA